MLTMGVRPKVYGAELLPPKEEAVVFVANHGSYLDIPVTNFLPRSCKVGVLSSFMAHLAYLLLSSSVSFVTTELVSLYRMRNQ